MSRPVFPPHTPKSSLPPTGHAQNEDRGGGSLQSSTSQGTGKTQKGGEGMGCGEWRTPCAGLRQAVAL